MLEDLGQKAEALDIVTEGESANYCFSGPADAASVLRERAHRGEYTVDEQTGTKRKATKSERAASQKLTKRVLEDQMRARMHDLWDDVQAGITGIEEGDPEGLNRFIFAAGTMIENFRLARGNFSKNRVSQYPLPKGFTLLISAIGSPSDLEDEKVWREE